MTNTESLRDHVAAKLHEEYECPNMDSCPMYTKTSSGASMAFMEGNIEIRFIPEPCLYQSKFERMNASPEEISRLVEHCIHFEEG